jgi:cell division protein FtsB
MNTELTTPVNSNPIQIGKILCVSSIVTILLAVGLGFVYIKNQQFAIGEQIRQTERKIQQVRAENDVLLAKVTELTSRPALQARVKSGYIAVVNITSDKIARLTPPVQATEVGTLRTAFNEVGRQ